jgi:hypothetical protein
VVGGIDSKRGEGTDVSRHVSRKERWKEEDPRRYTSDQGAVVYERGAWYALLRYHTRTPPPAEHGLPTWEAHDRRLGPFKRPRNAMLALERETTFLRNRHGDNVLFGELPEAGK